MAPFAILQKIQSSDTEIPSFLFQALIQPRYIGQRPQMRCLSHTYKTTISMGVLPNLPIFLQKYKNG
ncbi:MAG: hypothetical protein H6Q76_1691 [Firmicutes bacterium]|nr:hypothetical protein [Bacillota bacterium]